MQMRVLKMCVRRSQEPLSVHLHRVLHQNDWMWCPDTRCSDLCLHWVRCTLNPDTLSSHWPKSCCCLSPFAARHRFHHDSGGPGLWALYPGGPCTGGGLPLGMASHRPHLALLPGLDRCSPARVEPLHSRDPQAGLLSGLDLEGPKRCLIHPLIPLGMFLCACWCHDLLLWEHPVYSAKGKE